MPSPTETTAGTLTMESTSCLLLLCDEELPLHSPLPSPIPPTPRPQSAGSYRSLPLVRCSLDDDDQELKNAFRSFISREHDYAPRVGYTQHLRCSEDLSSARYRAVRWILLACGRLGLTTGTAFDAVNYIDRFISMNSSMKWECWMVELLCIACLSIASKLDEVSVPSLRDLQAEDIQHSFQPSTILEMELVVLKALNWRLICITPYSYMELLLWQMDSDTTEPTLATLITKLLLRSLMDVRFLEYAEFAVAGSALKCALTELAPLNSNAQMSFLTEIMPDKYTVEMDECHRIMVEHAASLTIVPHTRSYRITTDPVAIVPLRRITLTDDNFNMDEHFFVAPRANNDPKKRKRGRFIGRSLQD